MKLIVRNTHKYLSFFISVQLLLWTISGIYFAFNKIENVRGEQYRLELPNKVNLQDINFAIPDAINVSIKKRLSDTIVLASTSGGMRYLDLNGLPINHLTPDQAMQIVAESTTLLPLRVEQVNDSEKGSEYRGRALPIYRVITNNDEGSEINAYVNIYSGSIAAISVIIHRWKVIMNQRIGMQEFDRNGCSICSVSACTHCIRGCVDQSRTQAFTATKYAVACCL